MARKIVLLEANEIPWRIYDEFIGWQPDSTLARLLPRCRQYTTMAQDEGPLSPWITWPTFHRGVSNEVHKIGYFGQDLSSADAETPPIWQLLQRGNVRTGVCGPLQSYPLPKDVERYAFFMPDTFAAGDECYPKELSVFQRFNLAMARESTRNVSTSIDWKSALDFLARAPSLGLRAGTGWEILKHLVAERRNPWLRVRRRTYQPVLAFDLYLKQLEKTKPEFSNFFTNHVASAQHRYWAATFPDEYETFSMDSQWVTRFQSEIEFSMKWNDRFFADLVAFVDRNPDYLLMVASSMGQAAVNAERVETQLYIADLATFMRVAGVEADSWSERPAMAPKVSVFVEEDHRRAFVDNLSKLFIYGKPVNFEEKDRGFFNIGIGDKNVHDKPQEAQVGDQTVPFSELGLDYRKVEDEAGSTANHVPAGSLFIYDPQRDIHHEGRPTIPSTSVAPTLLACFGLPVPEYMSTPLDLLPTSA